MTVTTGSTAYSTATNMLNSTRPLTKREETECYWRGLGPCFEFWLVLHFTYRRSPYTRSGARTQAQNCERDLRQHLPYYRKGMAGVFGKLEDRVETAKRHVHRAQSDASATGRDDPSTEVHSLVTYLQSLKAP